MMKNPSPHICPFYDCSVCKAVEISADQQLVKPEARLVPATTFTVTSVHFLPQHDPRVWLQSQFCFCMPGMLHVIGSSALLALNEHWGTVAWSDIICGEISTMSFTPLLPHSHRVVSSIPKSWDFLGGVYVLRLCSCGFSPGFFLRSTDVNTGLIGNHKATTNKPSLSVSMSSCLCCPDIR